MRGDQRPPESGQPAHLGRGPFAVRHSLLTVIALLIFAGVGAWAKPLIAVAVEVEDIAPVAVPPQVDFANGLAHLLRSALTATGQVRVLSGEQLAAVERTGVHPAQVLVRVSVVDYSEGEEAAGLGRLLPESEEARARVTLRLELVDTATSETIVAEEVEGQPQERGLETGAQAGTWGFGMSDLQREPVGQALQTAVSSAAQAVVDALADVPWRGHVVAVDGQEIYIDAGADAQVHPGDTFVVVGQEGEPVGRVEVERVEARYAVSRPLDPGAYAALQTVREP